MKIFNTRLVEEQIRPLRHGEHVTLRLVETRCSVDTGLASKYPTFGLKVGTDQQILCPLGAYSHLTESESNKFAPFLQNPTINTESFESLKRLGIRSRTGLGISDNLNASRIVHNQFFN